MFPEFLRGPDVFSPRVMERLCALIRCLGPAADFATVRRAMDTQYPSAEQPQLVYFDIDPLVTNMMVFKHGMEFVLLAGGTQGTVHTSGLIAGWNNPNSLEVDAGASQQFADAVYAVRSRLGNAFTPIRGNWYLAGHSYGGAFCEAFAAIARFRDNANIIGISTFGSPRPGWERLQERLQAFPIRRWYNDTDPVPNVPPHTPEAPLLHFFLPNQLAQGMNHQVQPVGGRRISPDGTVTLTEEQSLPLSVTEPSILLWLAGSNCFGAQAHGMDEYARRFALMQDNGVIQPVLGPNRSPPEPPTEMTQREIGRVVDAAVHQSQEAAIPSVLPPLTEQPPPRARYTIHRRRGGWGIYLEGALQAMARRHGTALAMMREGNARLANMAR